MDYSDINVEKAKQALNECKNNIRKSNIVAISQSFASWQCDCKQVLVDSITKLSDECYEDLLNLINKYLSVIGYVESWQSYSDSISSLEKKIRVSQNAEVPDESYISSLKSKLSNFKSLREKCETLISESV